MNLGYVGFEHFGTVGMFLALGILGWVFWGGIRLQCSQKKGQKLLDCIQYFPFEIFFDGK